MTELSLPTYAGLAPYSYSSFWGLALYYAIYIVARRALINLPPAAGTWGQEGERKRVQLLTEVD